METECEVRAIDIAWLEEHDACEDQVELFRETFGESAPWCAESVRRAAAARLDLEWFAQAVLPAPAWRAYREAEAAAWRTYKEAEAVAWRARQEARATAWRARQEVGDTVWRACEEAKAPAWRAYKEARATALILILGLTD